MDLSLISIGTALWLGILTSISPCPLSTNVAAISYVGRRVEKTSLVLFAGLLYTLGRSVSRRGRACDQGAVFHSRRFDVFAKVYESADRPAHAYCRCCTS